MAVGGALFGGGGQRQAGPKSLVSFRAGKMTLDSGSNLVTPDKRKGLVTVDQGEQDHLMHFRWKDRTSGTVEDDLIIFPEDIEFKKVSQCTTGRVFILKFKSSSRKMFFWMQEPKADKDEEFCKKVNDYLNNPPAPGSQRAGGGGGSGGAAAGGGGGSGGGASGVSGLDLSNLGDSELQSLLNDLSQQQLMQLFGGSLGGGGGGGMSELASLLGQQSGRQRSHARQAASTAAASRSTPASTAAATTTTASSAATTTTTAAAAAASSGPATTTSSVATAAASGSSIQLSDLQNILSGLQGPGGGATGSAASAGPSVDLSSGLTAETMKPLLQNPDFVKRMKELLPSEHQGTVDVAEEIKGTVSSPQFQQALSLFSSAFQSAQLAPLIREFSLGDQAVAAATAGDMEAFVKALQKDKKGGAGGDKKHEPEDMALD